METMGRRGFHGLESPYSDFEKSKVVIVPFCYASDVVEAWNSPIEIIEASHEVPSFDESLMVAGRPVKAFKEMSLEERLDIGDALEKRGLATLRELRCAGMGTTKLKKDFVEIVSQLLKLEKFPVILGGDHSVTPLAIKAFKEDFDNLAVLHFDSRLDLSNPKESKHRSVMRQIFPEVEFIINVGYRSVEREEMSFLIKNEHKICGIMMRDQLRPLWRLEGAMKKIMHYLKGRNVYITFDASFLDPSTIGGHTVQSPEPGGMTYDEILYIWQKLLPYLNIVGADFVEFCIPGICHYNPASIRAFAKIISQFVSRLNFDEEGG